jgi:hypothetical protein
MEEGSKHGSSRPSSIKRRDIGIAGAAIMLAEALSNFQSSKNVSTEIVKFKEEFQQSRVDREQFFVRKTEIEALNLKLDKMSDQIAELSNQVTSLKTYLKSKWGYSAKTEDKDILPAVYSCIEGEEIWL